MNRPHGDQEMCPMGPLCPRQMHRSFIPEAGSSPTRTPSASSISGGWLEPLGLCSGQCCRVERLMRGPFVHTRTGDFTHFRDAHEDNNIGFDASRLQELGIFRRDRGHAGATPGIRISSVATVATRIDSETTDSRSRALSMLGPVRG